MQGAPKMDFTAASSMMRAKITAAMNNMPVDDNFNATLIDDALDSGFVSITLADIESTAGVAKEGDLSPVYGPFIHHSSAQRTHTDTYMTSIIRKVHPGSKVIVSRDPSLNFFSYPDVQLTPLSKEELLSHIYFAAPSKRTDPGQLTLTILFGAFKVQWSGHTFLMYTCQIDEGFLKVQQFWFINDQEEPVRQLLLAASNHSYQLHEEILVFAHGYWTKSHELWLDVQKAIWDDVILDGEFKKRVQGDINGFFASEKVYKDLSIPWKRGVIFLGPPGNGKTISLKAIMKNSPNPVLLVKNFTSFMGDEFSMQLVFQQARMRAPCIMILEDLDSLITEQNRSFFLNELDGMAGNDGILLIGTTNYFDHLDPALSKRPSRFDRKFEFLAPNDAERRLYMKYWQKKLEDSQVVRLTDELADDIVHLTDGFSFAYLKEAMVSSLVTVANNDVNFEDTIKEVIKTLRKSIDKGQGQD